LYAAILLGLIGMFSDLLSKYIHNAWMKLTEILGFFMNKLILGIVFFVFLTPIALLSRLAGRSNLKLKKQESSYFSERRHTYVS
ncbi:MAG: SxtJ family membrane protein, partial [Chitinophagales bacterium]|nr:SxtJ family membrane protein [Chitinophagales bacterium]